MPQQSAQASRPGQPVIEVAPITDVPYPKVDFSQVVNPIPAMLQAPEFAQTMQYFRENPSASRALTALVGQALLYATIRNLRPEHVVEIGTYKGGVTEV